MADALTIIGAAFEVVGLGLVFVELAFIRSHEFGTPPPWAPLIRRIRRLLGRPQYVDAKATMHIAMAMRARGEVRPGDAPPEATDRERLERLERYVERLDEDLHGMWQAFGRQEDKIVAEAARRDEQLRQEFEQRETDRREKLRPSLVRQAIGGTCVLLGIILGTMGSIL